MGQFPVTYVADFAVALVAAVAVYLYWVANRKRIAAETVGRGEQQAAQLLREAEREADARKKEAALEAKEQAHALLVETERLARDRRLEALKAEQGLAEKTQALAGRLATAERADHDLKAREKALAERERATRAAAERYDRLVADQQRDLQRVAGMTADEARDQLIRQMEADARREAATVVKRLEAEARETASGAPARSSRRPSSAARPSTPSRPRCRSSTCPATT